MVYQVKNMLVIEPHKPVRYYVGTDEQKKLTCILKQGGIDKQIDYVR